MTPSYNYHVLLSSYLIEGLLDLVKVIEIVLHCHTDGVHSVRAGQPLSGQQLIQVMLLNKMSKSKHLNALALQHRVNIVQSN